MIHLNIDDTICSLVNKFLDRSIYSHNELYTEVVRKGLLFQVNMRLSFFTDDQTYDVARQVFLLFTGNTSVFVAVAPRNERWYGWKEIPSDAWKNTSNHDSCWRSDGTRAPIIQLYFDMSEDINNHLVEDGLKEVPPIQMSQYNTLSNDMFTEMLVETESDPDTHNPSYFRKIKSLSELTSGQ